MVHDGKDALLDFPGVLGTANQRHPTLKIEQHKRPRGGAVKTGIRAQFRNVNHGEVCGEAFGLGRARRPNEHVLRE